MGRDAGPTGRFSVGIFVGFSIRKRIIKSGANQTLMLVVEVGTPGLPFECAQPVVSCMVLAAFMNSQAFHHGWLVTFVGS
jgi:hypothetical protein